MSARNVASHRDAMRGALARDGFAIVRASDFTDGDLALEASVAPWLVAEKIFGERPEMLERQPIRAIPNARSFASSDVFTPLHTDSQPLFGAPPTAQVMICERAAARGGASILADGFAMVRRVLETDADLAHRIFSEPRRIPFYFGDIIGPTVARKRGRLVITHSPLVPPGDALAARVRALVDAAPIVERRLEAGELLVVDNHRMLHGRRAFVDAGAPRELVRLLVWLPRAFSTDDALDARARDVVPPPAPVEHTTAKVAAHRRAVIHELVSGAPPGAIAARERITEAELYRWRDAALASSPHPFASS